MTRCKGSLLDLNPALSGYEPDRSWNVPWRRGVPNFRFGFKEECQKIGLRPEVVPASVRHKFPKLRHVFADSAHTGPKLAAALKPLGRWRLKIVKRPAGVQGFEVLPRRWVVERTLAWLSRNRRLAKDFETTLASAHARLFLASVQLIVRGLARL